MSIGGGLLKSRRPVHVFPVTQCFLCRQIRTRRFKGVLICIKVGPTKGIETKTQFKAENYYLTVLSIDVL